MLCFRICSRTELCAFSGYKIYPGHGKRLVKADGKVGNIKSNCTEVTDVIILCATALKTTKWSYATTYKTVQRTTLLIFMMLQIVLV